MPRTWKKGQPTAEDMYRAELEVGANIPDEMVGLDTEDVGDVDLPSRGEEKPTE